MKKIIAVLLLVGFILGCPGYQINQDSLVNLGADLAFLQVMKNNPSHSTEVIETLSNLKTFLSGNVTYADLMLEIQKYVKGNKYTLEITLISDYILQDSALIESIPILPAYKAELIKRIDRLILIAGSVVS